MATTTLEDLEARLEEATRGLPGVTSRRAFASPGFFADGAMFAFAWRSGRRLVVKLPDDASRASLLGIEGAAPWTPNGKRMGAWVALPEAWHDDVAAIRPWVRRAYEQVLRAAADVEVPSMGRSVARARKPAAIEVLHEGAARARRAEKPGTRTAAAPVPRRAKKAGARKSATKSAVATSAATKSSASAAKTNGTKQSAARAKKSDVRKSPLTPRAATPRAATRVAKKSATKGDPAKKSATAGRATKKRPSAER